jgi:hypothetical protein
MVRQNKKKKGFLWWMSYFIGEVKDKNTPLVKALKKLQASYKNGKFIQVSPSRKENAAQKKSALLKKKKMEGGAKILSPAKAKAQIMTVHSMAEKLYQKTKEDVYKQIDDYLLRFAKKYHTQNKKQSKLKSKSEINAHFQKLKKNDEGHKNNAMNSILKTLVEAIGKDSAGAMKARADLQRLLKKYPNQVPTALIGIVRAKLKKNGLGIILAIQLSATMIGLLLSIIPIPGLAIIGEAVAIAANMGTDLLVAVGPEQIIALLQNGSQKALEAFTKSMVPLIESVSGAFCCNSSGDKKNMEKFGKIMEHLIELEKIKNKEEAKAKIEAYIKEIQGVMSKPVPGVDMAALDKLIKKYPPPKDKEKEKTTDAAPKSGGKRRKTRKRRKRKTKKRRRKRRKRKTNKYRNKFTRRY